MQQVQAGVLLSGLQSTGRPHGLVSPACAWSHRLGTQSGRGASQCTKAARPCTPTTESTRALQWGGCRQGLSPLPSGSVGCPG